ncbi:MAG: tRNA (guanosine(46)-N7)-methyltransferase TrmB [Mycoplasmoidaceae bacterium]
MGRLRTNTKAPELVKQYPNYKDIDKIVLPNKPIYLEIGSGKGDFLITHALNHPNNFYIGIEKYSTVILKALKKIERNKLKLSNLIFACADAKDIEWKRFDKKISTIYLNFSDPWPKKRHEKRRLTSRYFLDIYKNILIKSGIVAFKTDNDGLYSYTKSLLLSSQDIDIVYDTTDLYLELHNRFNKDNIPTEYEKKFVQLNKNINKIVFKYK